MNENEFMLTSPRYFFNRQRGHFDGLYELEKSEWERTRWLALFVVAPHSSKKLAAKDLAVFPWEEGFSPAARNVTDDEWDAWRKQAADLWANKKLQQWQA